MINTDESIILIDIATIKIVQLKNKRFWEPLPLRKYDDFFKIR